MSLSDVSDSQFEMTVDRVIPSSAREKAFYAKLVGVSHENPDGTSRIAAIAKCKTFDILTLEAEPDNPFDSNAIAVLNEAGEQMGYLDSRLAEEATRDAQRSGPRWMVLFRHKNHHPQTGKVVGAVLFMIRLTDEFALEQERKVAEKGVKP